MIYYLSYNPDAFDWITAYCQKHKQIASPRDFKISDADYQSFGKMLEEKKFDYDRQSLKSLERLREIAEFEGHLKRAEGLIDSLKKALEPNLGKDLESLRPQVEEYLNSTIVTRYYYRRGALERALMTDKVVAKADEFLRNSESYAKILEAPQAVKK